MNHAIEEILMSIAYNRNLAESGAVTPTQKRKCKNKVNELTSALSLLEGASEWWACPGRKRMPSMVIDKVKLCKDRKGWNICIECPGPVKYLIAEVPHD